MDNKHSGAWKNMECMCILLENIFPKLCIFSTFDLNDLDFPTSFDYKVRSYVLTFFDFHWYFFGSP
jgi:hypothetical protein